MKKIFISVFLAFLLLGVLSLTNVYADDEDNAQNEKGCNNLYWIDNSSQDCSQKQFCGAYMYQGLQTFEDKEDCLEAINKTDDSQDDDFGDRDKERFRERLKIHNNTLNISGRNITVKEFTDEQKEIIANKINAKTGLNLSIEDIDDKTMLRAYLSNGRYALVKIMPDTASETALNKMRAKCEIRNCSVELKEVGNKNDTKLAYEVRAQKESKILGLFRARMNVQARVDAETGEVISVKKPWWSFMAKEQDD